MTYVLRVIDGPARGEQTAVSGRCTVGRGSVDLDLNDPSVSRSHFAVSVDENNSVLASDLDSSSGLLLNGRRITSERIQPGDVLTVGRSRVLLLQARPVATGLVGEQAEVIAPDGTRQQVGTAPVRIGRDKTENHMPIADTSVSRLHCELYVDSGSLFVADVGSRNGTFVNGERVSTARRLQAGDQVKLASDGPVVTVLRTPGESADVDTRRWVQVTVEGDERAWPVEIEAGADAPTVDVIRALEAYLAGALLDTSPGGTVIDRAFVLYRRRGGLLLDPAAPWTAWPIRRGDELVLAPTLHPRLEPTGPPLSSADHRVVANQRPRTTWPPERFRPVLPNIVEGSSLRGRGMQWQVLAGGVSVVGGLAVAFLRPDPLFRVFGLIFAAVGLVSLLSGILGDQSRRRHQERNFTQRLIDLNRQLHKVRVSQVDDLHAASPSVTELATWLTADNGRLWERRSDHSDFLAARLGRGRMPAAIDFDDGWRRSDSPLAAKIGELIEKHRHLDAAPVVTPGLHAPVISVWGDPIAVGDLVRSITLQIALLHSPRDVGISVLSTNDQWAWLRWLPHVEDVERLELSQDTATATDLAARLEEDFRNGEGQDRAERRARFIVLTEAVAATAAGRALLDAPFEKRAVVLVVCGDRQNVPSETSLEIECTGSRGRLRGTFDPASPAGSFTEITVEGLDKVNAMRLVAELAPLRDPRHSTRQPAKSIDLLGLLGLDESTARDPSAAWQAPPTPLLTVPIGQDEHGAPVTVGIRRDGPHGLIAGTTGSGKSVLLQTLLTTLALTHSPDRLNFFLVDFKGGATFKESGLAELPHTVGLVTDLEGQRSLTDRAFRSLNAEIARRKELVSAARVENILQYERLPGASVEPMPNLLVVIDEFALLVRDQPEVRDHLGVVAAQGRSLGVHLLLAMQSPQGVVSPEIKKNTNLWICLRVAQTDESMAVLDQPNAALLPPDEPGRGYIRIGASTNLTGFRAAQITARASDQPKVTVRPFLDEAPSGSAYPRVLELRSSETTGAANGIVGEVGTRELCVAMRDTAERIGVAPQRLLWLPPLRTELNIDELDELDERAGQPSPNPDHLCLRLGLADYPERQRQEIVWTDLTVDANLLMIGEFGSGKSSTLSHIGVDLAERYSPAEVHLYAIDSGVGTLAPLRRLPHVGAVVGADDTERLVRLLGLLSSEVSARRTRLTDAGTSWIEWRRSEAETAPWIALLVDDFGVLRDQAEELGQARVMEQLQTITQIGPSVGIHVVVAAAQRNDVRLSFQNLFGAKFALRMNDPADYDLVGLRASQVRGIDLPPGRGLVAGGAEVQTPLVDPDRIAAAAERWPSTLEGLLPVPVERLPNAIALSDILAVHQPKPTEVVLGVGGDVRFGPVSIDPDGFGSVLLVLGDDRTGRSTALRTWIEAASTADPSARFALFTPRRSPLRALVGEPSVVGLAVDEDDAIELLQAVGEAPQGVHLVIDDAEGLSDRAGADLEVFLRNARELDLRVVLSARTSDFLRLYQSWARYLVSLKSALLLMPTPEAASAVEARLPPAGAASRPGRGYLVNRGRLTLVQVAEPST